MVNKVALVLVAACLVACQQASSGGGGGTSYLSAPNVGGPSGLPATGADTYVSTSDPDTALGLLTDSTAALNSLVTSNQPVQSEMVASTKTLKFVDVRTGASISLPTKLVRSLSGVEGKTFRSLLPRTLVSGSKTPIPYSLTLYDAENNAVGTDVGSTTEWEEQSDEQLGPNKLFKNVDHVYLAADDTTTISDYSTTVDTATYTMSGKSLSSLIADLGIDLQTNSTEVSGIWMRGNLQIGAGIALSVKKTVDSTSIGGKFVFSFAAHQVYNVDLLADSPVVPPLEITYTVKAYDDSGTLVFSADQSETLSSPITPTGT